MYRKSLRISHKRNDILNRFLDRLSHRSRKLMDCFRIIVAISIIFAYIFFFMMVLDFNGSTVITVLFHLNAFSLLATLMIFVCHTSYFQLHNLHELHKNVKYLQDQFNFYWPGLQQERNCWFYACLVVVQVNIVVCGTIVLMRNSEHIHIISVFLVFDYGVCMIALWFWHHLLTVRRLLATMNKKLHKLDFSVCHWSESTRYPRLILLVSLYQKIYHLINTLSEIFGPFILSLYFVFLAKFVWIFTVLLMHFLIKEEVVTDYSLYNKFLIFANYWLISNLLCSTGTSINKKIKSASLDVFERFIKISLIEGDSQMNSDFKETLSLLVHFLTIKAPSITAGKFFNLDNTLLFTLLGSTYYYVAIFIQLK